MQKMFLHIFQNHIYTETPRDITGEVLGVYGDTTANTWVWK